MITHDSQDTTIEQTVTETPEVEELSDEALDRAPGRAGFLALLHVFSLEGI
jgi:hypothetical protein